MASKVASPKPQQSFDSLVYAFEGALNSPNGPGKYLIAEKEKGEHEIDGVKRDDVWCLDQKRQKHGVQAAAYRLNGRRAAHYKGARMFLEELAVRACDEGVAEDSASKIKTLLNSSRKSHIKIDDIRADVQKIIDASKAKAKKSADSVKEDFHFSGHDALHFIDGLDSLKLPPGRERDALVLSAKKRPGGGLLTDIDKINEQAIELLRIFGSANRLKFARPSFTSRADRERSGVKPENLLMRIAGWPGKDLQSNMSFVL